MSIISTFFGIYVGMFFDDHAPPHIHVEYQGHRAQVAIADGAILVGELPRRAESLVRQWCVDHNDELVENWKRALSLVPLRRIAGADND